MIADGRQLSGIFGQLAASVSATCWQQVSRLEFNGYLFNGAMSTTTTTVPTDGRQSPMVLTTVLLTVVKTIGNCQCTGWPTNWPTVAYRFVDGWQLIKMS